MYEDAERIYGEIAEKGQKLIEEAIEVIIPSSIPIPLEEPLKIERGRIIAINTLHIPRREIVTVPLSGSGVTVSSLKNSVVQVSRDGKNGYAIVEAGSSSVVSVSGMFVDTFTGSAQAFETESGDFILKNSNIELRISGGRIVSLYDVELDRELIPEGKDGGLVMFQDRPLYWVSFTSPGSHDPITYCDFTRMLGMWNGITYRPAARYDLTPSGSLRVALHMREGSSS